MIRRESDVEFAALLGVTQPALSQWRTRADSVDVVKVEKLAELCQVPFDWLLRGDRSDATPPNLFKKFLEVYRDWVARGGLVKKPPSTPDTKSERQLSREKTEPFVFSQKDGRHITLDEAAEGLPMFKRPKKTAPVATGFQKMSSKELTAAKKKPKKKRA